MNWIAFLIAFFRPQTWLQRVEAVARILLADLFACLTDHAGEFWAGIHPDDLRLASLRVRAVHVLVDYLVHANACLKLGLPRPSGRRLVRDFFAAPEPRRSPTPLSLCRQIEHAFRRLDRIDAAATRLARRIGAARAQQTGSSMPVAVANPPTPSLAPLVLRLIAPARALELSG